MSQTPERPARTPSHDALAIEFASASYALPTGRALVSNLNLRIRAGETRILLGRSGSGKSTTLKLINRMLDHAAIARAQG